MSKQKLVITIIAFAVLALILGYGFYVKEKRSEEKILLPITLPETKSAAVITYQITGGLAAYKEETKIFSEGKIDYMISSAAPEKESFRTANISKEELDRLIKLFIDNKFASFKDIYGSRAPVADAPKTIITFNFKGMDSNDPRLWYGESVISKQVTIEEDTAEIPDELEEIKQELAKKAEWFKSLLPKLEFSQGKGDCSLAKDLTPEIKLESNDIVFQGRINTGNPCYNLSAKIETKEDIFSPETGILTITISSFPSDKICIQCAGSIGYSGKITNLSGMSKYKVIIKARDAVIAEKEINIPITPIYENKQ